MSLIDVRQLTFHYEGSPDTIFENVSFQIDTDWKLGFISRNGRGKTTFLRLLTGAFAYQGDIRAGVAFSYFPYEIADADRPALEVARDAIAPFSAWEREMERLPTTGDEASLLRYDALHERMLAHDGYLIDEHIRREAGKLQMDPSALSRPFALLSGGERTKLMIAALFLKKDGYPLIDEPTNHLDARGRAALEAYMSRKKGFILVSHDRALLDGVVDHVLSINRTNIEIQQGNYSSWHRNREQQDMLEVAQNEQLKRDIRRLTDAMRRSADWSDQVEASKIGGHVGDRGAVGHKAAKMMQLSKNVERRARNALDDKTRLLRNIESAEPLKIRPLPYPQQRMLEARGFTVRYGDRPLFAPVHWSLLRGERVAVTGPNGCGKTSFLKRILGRDIPVEGQLIVGSRLSVSYVSQETAHLTGALRAYAQAMDIDETLLKTILRKLDFTRAQFDHPMETYSAGQKKKVLLAASLCQSAHLYIWDEPLNFVDILSRVQLEDLILTFQPTMLFVEHDRRFVQKIATGELALTPP